MPTSLATQRSRAAAGPGPGQRNAKYRKARGPHQRPETKRVCKPGRGSQPGQRKAPPPTSEQPANHSPRISCCLPRALALSSRPNRAPAPPKTPSACPSRPCLMPPNSAITAPVARIASPWASATSQKLSGATPHASASCPGYGDPSRHHGYTSTGDFSAPTDARVACKNDRDTPPGYFFMSSVKCVTSSSGRVTSSLYRATSSGCSVVPSRRG